MIRRKSPKFFSGENFRFIFLGAIFIVLFGSILARLFFLQIAGSEEIREKSGDIRQTAQEISARRGNIFTLDSKTGDLVPLAINTTLYKVFVDARENITDQKNFELIAKTLSDTLYTQKKYKKCLNNSQKCPAESVREIKNADDEIILTTLPTYNEAREFFRRNILKKISTKKTYITYATEVPDEILQTITNKNLSGIDINTEKKSVSINLQTLSTSDRISVATVLAENFGGKAEDIAEKLIISNKGYVPILSRVTPDKIDELKKIKHESRKKYLSEKAVYSQLKKRGSDALEPDLPVFQGIGFEPEPLRYYPEGSLASNIIGFLNNDGEGQYGIEKKLNTILSGEDGKISANRDVHGNAVSIKKNASEEVIDGANIVLTIDRILQKQIEELLDSKVEEYQADSGQIIIMEPQTGNILVMANSPRFNPNFFGEVYTRKKIQPEDRENIFKTMPLEQKDREGNLSTLKFPEFEEKWEVLTQPQFYMFKNRLGPGAYVNKTVSELYEPGSVMKPLVMAAAMEEGEINPYTRYFESAPLEVGRFTIRNADGEYLGSQTMSNIMERSANLGMAFIAKKMGKPILYDALKQLRLGEYTNILLPDELSGDVKYYKKWSDALMYTASFGQGFSATPLQVVRAWGSLANGGFLVTPHIVSYIEYADGSQEKPPHERVKVFSSGTVASMKKILISSVEIGVAKKARMVNHYIAGKTGTSQITKIDGAGYEDLDEAGSTITGFIGYAPVDDPKFVVLVKFDRPRKGAGGRAVFGSSTSAPTFKEVMQQLFYYYDIPRDKF